MGRSDTPFSNAACNLGVIFDSQLALKKQRTNSINMLPWRSGRSVQSDTIFLLKPPRLFSLLFRLGFIIVMLSLLALLTFSLIKFICKPPKSAHITCLPYSLHWLPISSRIQYKTAFICFHIVSGTASPYLCELLHLYSPSRSLRSASDTRIFRVPGIGRGPSRRNALNTSDL